MYPWLIHVDEWQNPPQCCKVMSPIKLKKKSDTTEHRGFGMGGGAIYLEISTTTNCFTCKSVFVCSPLTFNSHCGNAVLSTEDRAANGQKCVRVCMCVHVCNLPQQVRVGVGTGNELQIGLLHPWPPRALIAQRRVSEGLRLKTQEGFRRPRFLTFPFHSEAGLDIFGWQYAKSLDDFTQSSDSMAWDISPEHRLFLCSETRPQLLPVGLHASPAFLTLQSQSPPLEGTAMIQ